MISWAYVARPRDTYDWSSTDQIIRETTNRGIQPFVFLYGTPDWAARIDGRTCTTDCAVYAPRTQQTREAFGAFAAAAAARYGPEGAFWEAPILREDEPD